MPEVDSKFTVRNCTHRLDITANAQPVLTFPDTVVIRKRLITHRFFVELDVVQVRPKLVVRGPALAVHAHRKE